MTDWGAGTVIAPIRGRWLPPGRHSAGATTTPDYLAPPARRRRNARLIATLTELVGACAEAAGAAYPPIAAAPPGQRAVDVAVLPCIQVSLSAAALLDLARSEDDARWPAAGARERAESSRTYTARCAVAQATELAGQAGLLGVPPPTVEQIAAIDLVSAGEDVAEYWRQDPQQAVALVRELVAGGEFAADEVLDSAALTALMALQEVRDAPDPSTAAELCLSAVPHIALAVTLAGVDPD